MSLLQLSRIILQVIQSLHLTNTGNHGQTLHSAFPAPEPETLIGSGGGYGLSLPNALGNDPIKASFLAARSNPLIHLLAAPYIRNIKENNGADLPSIDDIQDLLERSSFGLSGLGEK